MDSGDTNMHLEFHMKLDTGTTIKVFPNSDACLYILKHYSLRGSMHSMFDERLCVSVTITSNMLCDSGQPVGKPLLFVATSCETQNR